MSPIWWVIICGAVATYLLRASFILAAARLGDVDPRVEQVLQMIPAAALGALALPALLLVDGSLTLAPARIAAAAVAMLVAWRTRNLGLTVVVGLSVYAAVDSVL